MPVDAEALAVRHLATKLADVRGFRRGAPKGRQLQVRGTGGTARDLAVYRHQLTLTAWGRSNDDEEAAQRLAAEALAWLQLAEREGWLAGVPFSNLAVYSLPYADPDPTTGRARYSFTVAADLRGDVYTA